MRTAPVRAGCTGATPAFHGQRAWTGNPPQTAIDRKPLQTDKLTGRAFDDEVYAVVAQIPAGKIVSYKQIARLIGMPDHARRVGRAMASAPNSPAIAWSTAPGAPPPAGRSNGNCSKRKAFASRPTAAPTSSASCGRKSCNPHRTCPTTGTRIGSCDGKSTGNPAGKGIRPTPPDTIARQAAATYRRKKFGIPHQNRYLRIIPHTLRTYCGGQYSPPGMRLPGKSTA